MNTSTLPRVVPPIGIVTLPRPERRSRTVTATLGVRLAIVIPVRRRTIAPVRGNEIVIGHRESTVLVGRGRRRVRKAGATSRGPRRVVRLTRVPRRRGRLSPARRRGVRTRIVPSIPATVARRVPSAIVRGRQADPVAKVHRRTAQRRVAMTSVEMGHRRTVRARGATNGQPLEPVRRMELVLRSSVLGPKHLRHAVRGATTAIRRPRDVVRPMAGGPLRVTTRLRRPMAVEVGRSSLPPDASQGSIAGQAAALALETIGAQIGPSRVVPRLAIGGPLAPAPIAIVRARQEAAIGTVAQVLPVGARHRVGASSVRGIPTAPHVRGHRVRRPVPDDRLREVALVGHRVVGLIVRATDRGNAHSLAIVTVPSTVATIVPTAASDRAEQRVGSRRLTACCRGPNHPGTEPTDRFGPRCLWCNRNGMGPIAHHPRYVV
jgi:hypothetical protein